MNDDIMTITSLMSVIQQAAEEKEPKYKVRAIDEMGNERLVVGGWGTEVFTLDTDLFKDALDVEQRLLPSIKAENNHMDTKIVRLEVVLEKVEPVAAVDLTVKKTGVETNIGEWEPLV